MPRACARSLLTLSAFVLAVLLGLLIAPPVAHAHGEPGAAGWGGWNHDPLAWADVLALGAVYALGVARAWRSFGVGRGLTRAEVAAFTLGVLALGAALVSPIDTLSDELAWMHMVQHMLIMMVAAPLLVLGRPLLGLLWALPARWRLALSRERQRPAWRLPGYMLWQPVVTWSLFAVTLWVWHLPVAYEAALRNEWLHGAQHLAFLASACLFWRVVFDPLGRLRLGPALGVLYLFGTSLHATLLGVFMALAPQPWYPFYVGTVGGWRLTALEDQQLAGLIMWMPACGVYAVAAAGIFGVWMWRGEGVGGR